MNVGDLVLDKKVMAQAEETFQNMSESDIQCFSALMNATGFLAEMFFEVFESSKLDKLDMSPDQRLHFGIKLLAQVSSLCCLKMGSRTSNMEAVKQEYKHTFQTLMHFYFCGQII